jgi:hypothetical protein
MTLQPLFPGMVGCTVTTPGLMPGILLDVLIDEPVILFFEVRPRVMLRLDAVFCQNFLHAVDI